MPVARPPATRKPASLRSSNRRTSRSGRFGLVALVGLCLFVLAGCKTTAWVRVDVRGDGSGSVAVDVYLDADAAKQVGDLSKMLSVDDLKRAGWEITGPAAPAVVARKLGSDKSEQQTAKSLGAVQVHLEHSFSNVDEANQILASLSGPDGPFRKVKLTKGGSLFKTHLGFTGTVDLSRGLDTFGDADLSQALGGTLSEKVAASGGVQPKGDDLTVGLQIVPSKSLDWSGEMGNESTDHETVGASATLGSKPQSINVHSSKTRSGPVAVAAIVVLAILGGLIFLGVRLRRPADEAERVLLAEIEVPDPFGPSEDDANP